MNSVILSLNYHLSEDQRMSCIDTQITRPTFGGWNCWCIDGEGIVLHVISGSSLQTSDIWPMTKLGLSIAPINLTIAGFLEPSLLLPLGSKHFNTLDKHSGMNAER